MERNFIDGYTEWQSNPEIVGVNRLPQHATLMPYETFEEAKMALFEFIEGWYNRKRIHSSINYMTPEQCELLARSAA